MAATNSVAARRLRHAWWWLFVRTGQERDEAISQHVDEIERALNARIDSLEVALTERSLVEAGDLAGFETERLITRFLPYTTKSRLPEWSALVRAYLAFPPAWRVFGKQTLYVGRRSHDSERHP